MKKQYEMHLRKFVSPEIICGIDARLLVGQYLHNFESERPMIVTDAHVAQQDWYADMIREIESKVKHHTVFLNITPNPKDYEVMEGARLFLENRCDLLIAVGGGSPMDCAKGIAIVSTNGGNILDYEGVDRVREMGPPLICVPSTAGTSADVSQFAIILDSEHSIKKAIISKKVVPDLALVDPVPLTSVDPYLAACTGMDALTHAIEAYVSNANSSLTDVWAIDAIRNISANLEAVVAGGNKIETLYPVMLGSLQAGLAFSNASLGAVHAMAHSLGGLLNLPHGECNSILLGPVINANFDSAPSRYSEIASAMGIVTAGYSYGAIKEKLVTHVSQLRKKIGIRERIEVKDYNSYRPLLVSYSMKDPCMITNPKQLTESEVRDIYESVIRAI